MIASAISETSVRETLTNSLLFEIGARLQHCIRRVLRRYTPSTDGGQCRADQGVRRTRTDNLVAAGQVTQPSCGGRSGRFGGASRLASGASALSERSGTMVVSAGISMAPCSGCRLKFAERVLKFEPLFAVAPQ